MVDHLIDDLQITPGLISMVDTPSGAVEVLSHLVATPKW